MKQVDDVGHEQCEPFHLPFEHALVHYLDQKNKTLCSIFFLHVLATVILKVWLYVTAMWGDSYSCVVGNLSVR